jgi:cytochrome c553
MIKKVILSTAIIISIIGCSDKKEENTSIEKKVEVQTKEQAPLVIEIEKNEDAKEIKVVEKDNGNKKNDTYYFNYNGVKTQYDPNSEPANKDAKIRIAQRSAIDANMHVRSPYEKVKISMLVKNLSKDFIVKCSACHNDYANGVVGPSLLSKNSDFIFDKIKVFKEDPKANVLMADLVKQMSDEEIRKIANEIYQFNKEIKEL